MKKTIISLITLIAALSLTCTMVTAGGEKEKDMQQSEQMSQSQSPTAEELKGMQVVNQNGEEIGEIETVNIDAQSGKITYVTLARGGILGMGEESVAVPLEAFNFDMQQQQATLTVDQNKLDNAPQQAEMDSQTFQQELESHYGISPGWQDEQQQQEQQMEQDMQQEQEMQQMDQESQPQGEGY